METITLRRVTSRDPASVVRSSLLGAELLPNEVERICERLTSQTIAAGDMLFDEGDEGDALYFVRRGRVRVEVREGDGLRLLAELGATGFVGEMALVSGEPRRARVSAARDSVLLRLDRASFHDLVQSMPPLGLSIARAVITRVGGAADPPAESVYALGLAHDEPALDPVADAWIAAMKARQRVCLITAFPADSPPDLDALETGFPIVIFDLRGMDEAERAWALRQTDRCVVFEARGRPRDLGRERELVERTRRDVPTDHVIVGARDNRAPCPVLGEGGALDQRYNTDGSEPSIARIVRNQLGMAVSMAMSGGGLRGVAHIGAYQAWNEAGFVIDRVAGTSAGAWASAAIATQVTPDEVVERTFAVARLGLWRSFGPPFVSILSGVQIAAGIALVLEDVGIEDLHVPAHLVCASLLRADVVVPRTGSLRRVVRASTSLPGVWPAVPFGDDLLVDGGVLDNLPAERVRPWSVDGFVVGVDVSDRFTDMVVGPDADRVSGWSILWSRIKARLRRLVGGPAELPALPNHSAVETLIRASTLAGVPRFEAALAKHAHAVIRPEIPAWAMAEPMRRRSLEAIIASGRDAALRRFDAMTEDELRRLRGEPPAPP